MSLIEILPTMSRHKIKAVGSMSVNLMYGAQCSLLIILYVVIVQFLQGQLRRVLEVNTEAKGHRQVP
jgi:hypothetical protein